MTRAEAGRLGGRKTAERHPGHHMAAGRKGGATTAERGAWFFAAIGAKGGAKTRTRRGRAWFSELSKGDLVAVSTGSV